MMSSLGERAMTPSSHLTTTRPVVLAAYGAAKEVSARSPGAPAAQRATPPAYLMPRAVWATRPPLRVLH